MEHCIPDQDELDYNGKVLVLSPDALRESHWNPQNQLWLATGGAGCSTGKLGRTVFATCLADGEETRWGREDFTGILDERYLPDWAAEKLTIMGVPTANQRSVCGGERRSSEVSESCRERQDEGYGACDDEPQQEQAPSGGMEMR